jgi:hypothetical protein
MDLYNGPYEGLNYDEQILREKLGINQPEPPQRYSQNSLENQLHQRELIRQEVLNAVAKQQQQQNSMQQNSMQQKSMPPVESVSIKGDVCSGCSKSCGCKNKDDDDENPLLSQKVYLFILFVIIAFCFFQYMHINRIKNDIDGIIEYLYHRDAPAQQPVYYQQNTAPTQPTPVSMAPEDALDQTAT